MAGQVLAHQWYSPRGYRVGNWRHGDVGSMPSRAAEEANRLKAGYTVVRAYAPDPGKVDFNANDAEDLRRFVLLAHYGSPRKPRWCHVSDRTTHGSGMSVGLCHRFGLDPDEVVGRNDPVRWTTEAHHG